MNSAATRSRFGKSASDRKNQRTKPAGTESAPRRLGINRGARHLPSASVTQVAEKSGKSIHKSKSKMTQDKRRGITSANNNKINPSESLLQWQHLCRHKPLTVKQFQEALGQTGRTTGVTASRYCKQGFLTRINPGIKPALYGHPPPEGEPVVLESKPTFEKLAPRLPKPHPLVAVWMAPRMPTNHLQGVWG